MLQTKTGVTLLLGFIIGFAIGTIIFTSISCSSTNAGTGQSVLDSVEQLGRLSEQNRQLTDSIERQQELYQQFRDSIAVAESNAAGAALDLRGAIKLLTEYKQRVDEYFKAVDNSTGTIKDGT